MCTLEPYESGIKGLRSLIDSQSDPSYHSSLSSPSHLMYHPSHDLLSPTWLPFPLTLPLFLPLPLHQQWLILIPLLSKYLAPSDPIVWRHTDLEPHSRSVPPIRHIHLHRSSPSVPPSLFPFSLPSSFHLLLSCISTCRHHTYHYTKHYLYSPHRIA